MKGGEGVSSVDKSKLLVFCYSHDPGIELEKEFLDEQGITAVSFKTEPREDISQLIEYADAFVTQYNIVDSRIIDAMKKCKLIMKYGTGYDNIDVAYAEKKGIYCCNIPDFCSDEVSNHALAFILNLARGIARLDKAMRRGVFSFEFVLPLPEFGKMTVGIIGMGSVGKSICHKLKPFDVKILGYDPYLSRDAMREIGIEKADLNEICEKSDFITIHCLLNKETYHLIGENQFKRMKRTAYIINTARGSIIDESALIDALEENRIKGAGLDVYENEPVSPSSKLLLMDNVILTPHSGAQSEGSDTQLRKRTVQEVARVLRGEKPANPVNHPMLY
jgi:D-3-phosphoglycerate dehydrogenase / 2-oxoglutarate reductase